MTAIPGSLIHGTLLNSDLIPTFFAELDDDEQQRLLRRYKSVLDPVHPKSDRWDNEAADDLLSELFDALDRMSPPGYTFRAHEGDHSDFGWWQ